MVGFFTALFSGVVALSSISGISGAPADSGSALEERSLYLPPIVEPFAGTVWTIGQQASVTWDASNVPTDADPIPYVALYKASTAINPVSYFVNNLATKFDAHTGSVSFNVPNVDPGTYLIMLGAYAHSSYQFQIQPAGAVLFVPTITTPNSATVWTAGQSATVSWDASNVPANARPIGWISLYTTSSYGSAIDVGLLAGNVDPRVGSINILVPDVPAGDYFIISSIWGHTTRKFHINVA